MPRTPPYRNIFLFVSGRTPQIITETLAFFLKGQRPPIQPHEIHVLTTSEGQALICQQLLSPQTGQFYRFCRDYRLDPRTVQFSAHTVEVLRDPRGQPLTDIRTDADNRAAADQIVAKVRSLTRPPHSRLYASLAGGRKTMGLYLGFALQFYGRPQDRLTHVLISPPELENNPQFFYPPVRGSSRGQTATVTVANVPLVLLGHKLSVLRDRAELSYVTLVAQSQREVDLLAAGLPLTVERMGRYLRVGSARIPLSGLEFALYVLVARKRCQASCVPTCPGCPLCTVGTADFLDPTTLTALETIAAELGVRDPRLRELGWWQDDEVGKTRFLQVCARIKRKVREVLGEASGQYTIAPLQTRQDRLARYTIGLSKALIRLR